MSADTKVAERPRGPGRPPTTSLNDIVNAGCQIGLERLTLNAVATELDVHVATLYRYVAGRDELAQLVADRIVDSLQLPSDLDCDLDTEHLLVEYAIRLRHLLVDNPGLAGFSLTAGGSAAVDRQRAAACEALIARGEEPTNGMLLFDETALYTIAWVYATDPSLVAARRPVREPRQIPQILAQAEQGYQPADDDRWFAWCVRAHIRGVVDLVSAGHMPWS